LKASFEEPGSCRRCCITQAAKRRKTRSRCGDGRQQKGRRRRRRRRSADNSVPARYPPDTPPARPPAGRPRCCHPASTTPLAINSLLHRRVPVCRSISATRRLRDGYIAGAIAVSKPADYTRHR